MNPCIHRNVTVNPGTMTCDICGAKLPPDFRWPADVEAVEQAPQRPTVTLTGVLDHVSLRDELQAQLTRVRGERDHFEQRWRKEQQHVAWKQQTLDEQQARYARLAKYVAKIDTCRNDATGYGRRRELERVRHGEQVEGDYICPDTLRADAAEKEIADLRKEDPMAPEFSDPDGEEYPGASHGCGAWGPCLCFGIDEDSKYPQARTKRNDEEAARWHRRDVEANQRADAIERDLKTAEAKLAEVRAEITKWVNETVPYSDVDEWTSDEIPGGPARVTLQRLAKIVGEPCLDDKEKLSEAIARADAAEADLSKIADALYMLIDDEHDLGTAIAKIAEIVGEP